MDLSKQIKLQYVKDLFIFTKLWRRKDLKLTTYNTKRSKYRDKNYADNERAI